MMRYFRLYLVAVAVILFQFGCSENQPNDLELEDTKERESGMLVFRSQIFPSADCSVNRANLQNLFNTTPPNLILLINPGVYCIDGTLTIPSNVHIDFSGATIERETETTTVFDMLANNFDSIIKGEPGNSGITLENLTIDGNAGEDGLSHLEPSHYFSGLRLENCHKTVLNNISANETVNLEYYNSPPAAGIFALKSRNITCSNIDGYNNDGTAIIFRLCQNLNVNGSTTVNNFGSGFSTSGTNDTQLQNLVSYDTSINSNVLFSNITINGLRNTISNVTTYGANGSGLNIGHAPNSVNGTGNPSHTTSVDGVISHDNGLDGITVTYSDDVTLENITVSDNQRNNVYIYRSSRAIIDGANIFCNQGFVSTYGQSSTNPAGNILPVGIWVKSELSTNDPLRGGYEIYNTRLENNRHGILFEDITGPQSTIGTLSGSDVEIYNTGLTNSNYSIGIHTRYSSNININYPIIINDNITGASRLNYGVFVQSSSNITGDYNTVDIDGYINQAVTCCLIEH